MTTITLTKQDSKNYFFDTIRVNGRKLHAGRIERINKIGAGKWAGIASGYKFKIIGGLDAGGDRNSWYVVWELDGDHDPVHCTSAKAAIEWINNL